MATFAQKKLKETKTLIYLLLILAVAFWGISYVWMKIVFEYFPPIATMFFRLVISSGFLYVLFRKNFQKIQKADFRAFLLLSFFSPFCYFLAESFGLLHVSPTIASVVIATIPLFSPFLGLFAFNEKLSITNILGFIVSFVGILLMVFDDHFRFDASPLGLLLLFGAVLSALANIVFLKKLTAKYNSYTIITVQNFAGAIFFLPLFLIFDFATVASSRPSMDAILSLIALAVFASSLAFMFYTSGVRVLGVAKASIFTNLIPVITAVSSFFLLNEALGVDKIVGIGVVIMGLLLSQSAKLLKKF
ncbi:MAG TPA: EamA family transporter [Bacteroidales bacterium]|nr:EamA family transporter [Bacteroidales bacterium]